jgi:hypothetical protein|tara:strand:+ start:2614 stop:3090 length:477 start_codon:yes stop_codon:yes gene_type:complete
MKCVNDFLDEGLFKKIQDDIFDKDSTPWFCIPDISGEGKEKDAYFCHMLYDQERPCSNKYWIAEALKFVIDAKALIRVKVNLYPRTDTLVHHTPHTDFDFDHKAAVLSLNTCDGHTSIKGMTVPSRANRIVFFDPQEPHNSTNCTDQQFRANININYF